MDFGLALLLTAFSGALFFMLLAIYYFKKIKQKLKENPKGAATYGQNIVYGIVTGASVLVIDRIVNLLFEGFAKVNLNANSSWEVFGSLLSLLVYTFFDVALMFCLIFYLIHKGLPAIGQAKKKLA